MTLEAWVRPAVVSNAWRDVIYKGDDNYYLESDLNGWHHRPAGRWRIIGGELPPRRAVARRCTANTWAHLALTYDGTTVRLYVNGIQVSSTAKTGTIRTSTNQLQIGGDSIYGQYFQGIIDEIPIYNQPLSAAAIQTNMNTARRTWPAAGSDLAQVQPSGEWSTSAARLRLKHVDLRPPSTLPSDALRGRLADLVRERQALRDRRASTVRARAEPARDRAGAARARADAGVGARRSVRVARASSFGRCQAATARGRRQKLRDLDRVQRRALAEVVCDDEEDEAVLDRWVSADAADKYVVRLGRVARGRELLEPDPRGVLQGLRAASPAESRPLGLDPNRLRVPDENRYTHAGGADRQHRAVRGSSSSPSRSFVSSSNSSPSKSQSMPRFASPGGVDFSSSIRCEPAPDAD